MIHLYKVQLIVDRWSKIYVVLVKWSHLATFTCNKKNILIYLLLNNRSMVKNGRNIFRVFMNYPLSKEKK